MLASTRRVFLIGAAAALTGCGGGASAPAPVPRFVANPAYDAWVAAFRGRALAQGISAATFDTAFRSAGFLPEVIERDRNQTEFTRTLEDYLAIAASDARIATGQTELRRQASTLAAIQARFGVPPQVVTAIWGLESRYGARRGDLPVIAAMSTLAFDGRRGSFFEQQLVAALKILERGDITAARMTGSWAGAMGHTQFIPTSYEAFAVDFNGDGRRDIWSDDPTDALASAAAYLSRNGWRTGAPWGVEAALPPGFDTGLTGRGKGRSVSAWGALGVRAATGGALPDHGSASILIPQGVQGPAFAVYRNFSVLLTYNNAINYGIGVGHLSDRLAGGGPLRGSFPPDANGLTLEDRKALQRSLNAAGFDVGEADGVIGSRTVAAIEAYQTRAGLPVTGTPSPALLAALR